MIKIFLSMLFLISSALVVYPQTLTENQTASSTYSESTPYKPSVAAQTAAQSDSKKSKKPKSNSAKKSETTQVNIDNSVIVPLTVVNNRGVIINDLKQSDFQLFVDDQEVKNFSLEKKEDFLNIILLVDTSPSTEYQIADIQNYAAALVKDLEPQDRVMIAEFNSALKIKTGLTADRQLIDKAIRKTQFGDGTALYDSLQEIFEKNTKFQEGRTALIMITDGVDTVSGNSRYETSLKAAEKSGIPVFVVYVDIFDEAGKNIKLDPKGVPKADKLAALHSSAVDYERGKQYLNALISLSGGRAFLLKSLTDAQNKSSAKFAEEMRSKYYLKFTPPVAAANGERKEIKVRINRPDLIISARGSFIADQN